MKRWGWVFMAVFAAVGATAFASEVKAQAPLVDLAFLTCAAFLLGLFGGARVAVWSLRGRS